MFGENLRNMRIKRGFTQSQLGDRISVSDKTISSWEVNRTEPAMGMIDQLAHALNCSKVELIGDVSVLTVDECELIAKYRALDLSHQKMIRAALDALFDETKKPGADTLSA